MFERFAAETRQIIVLAQDEAVKLSHDHIGTEHMLLALLQGDQGTSGRALESLGITTARVRWEVLRLVGQGDVRLAGQMSFTPRAKAALEFALHEALAEKAEHIEPRHLLMGIAGEGEGVGARILRERDVDLELLRSELTQAG